MGDFPPKERVPASWLPGGSGLYLLLQLVADWEVTAVFARTKTLANVVFEPTPFRTSALNWRLRPLGQLTCVYANLSCATKLLQPAR
uniref:Uncharacterized protein n=1 Tax=Hyaloperonospora arabidopsidis (strain Emoy2) TaxID=559515 RepID=M4B1H4_HYAAE